MVTRIRGTPPHKERSSHEPNMDEYVQTLAKRMVYSRTYAAFYLSVILAGIVEVVWILLPHGGVGQLPDHILFTVVENYVTLGLLCDISMRAALQRRRFCREVANLVDTFVLTVSITTSVLMAIGRETEAELLVAEVLITVRVVFRLLRLRSITRSFQRQQAAADRKLEINLSDEALLGDVEAGGAAHGLWHDDDEGFPFLSPERTALGGSTLGGDSPGSNTCPDPWRGAYGLDHGAAPSAASLPSSSLPV